MEEQSLMYINNMRNVKYIDLIMLGLLTWQFHSGSHLPIIQDICISCQTLHQCYHIKMRIVICNLITEFGLKYKIFIFPRFIA